MTTKHFIKYTTGFMMVAGLLTAFSSCKKYLEVEPVSTFGPDYVFSNVGNAEKAIISAYAPLGGDQGYGIRLNLYYPLDNDEMMGQGGGNADNERRDIAHYNVQPSNTQLAGPYGQLYVGVERTNLAIYYIPKMSQYTNGTEAEKSQLKRLYGEALTLRAQYYFELIRNWGDVPAQFEPSSFQGDLFKPKVNRDSTYDHIIADLATAETLVPWRTEATQFTNERISQGAVRALRARIALFRGGYSLREDKQMKRDEANYKKYYQIARDECNAIMQRTGDHRLNNSYLSVWKDYVGKHLQEPNGEILWEVGMSGGNSTLGDSKLGYYNGPRYNNTGNSALTILPTYFYSFNPNDSRRDVMCAPYDINVGGILVGRPLQTMVDGKFRKDWTNILTSEAQYFGTNWPLIRYSDVLLMFAETENELNNAPTAAAITAYEQVRRRAFGTAAIGATPNDKAGFFTAIVNERAWELGGEGIRKYDLIRWNMLQAKLDESKARMRALYTASGNVGGVNQYVYPGPDYSKIPFTPTTDYTSLPATMYYKPNVVGPLTYANSFYEPAPATAPVGFTGVSWVSRAAEASNPIFTAILNYYAKSFTPNKNELLPFPQSQIDVNPNLKQNPGY
jgi:hypothetical protein